MSKMFRSVVSKVMWVGRATVFLVGLAVILAVLFGVATTAAAHSGSAGLFHLNHNNNVTSTLTKLTGNLTGQVLKIENKGSGPALALQAGTDRPPLTVNAAAGTATGLSADELDGVDKSGFYAAGSKVADSEQLDGLNSTQFIQGQGRVIREAKAVSAGVANSTILSNDVFEMWFSCPSTPTTTNGSVAFFNKTSSQANLFSDNGGANPAYASLAPALGGIDFSLQQTTAAGESITFQMQSANGKFVTVWFNSVNRTNDCHIQAQALISD